MRKWARPAALLMAVCICLAGCSSQMEEKEPNLHEKSHRPDKKGYTVASEVVNKTEDGVHIMTAVPVFSEITGAEELNRRIKEASDEGLAQVKQAAEELKNTKAHGLFFMSYYDCFWDNDVLSVWITNEDYEGGAHGSKWVRSFTMNIMTGDFYETPGDLFKYSTAGTKRITDKILADIQQNKDVFFPEAAKTVTDKKGKYSFYLDGENLVVYFDRCELAAYVEGIPSFSFPLKDLDTKCHFYGTLSKKSVWLNGAYTDFGYKPVPDGDGSYRLPLEETGKALGHTVKEKGGKYTVDGKSVKPMMIDGEGYMPISYFNNELGKTGIQGFAAYDGQVLHLFTQNAKPTGQMVIID